jgi:hypothetical protein
VSVVQFALEKALSLGDTNLSHEGIEAVIGGSESGVEAPQIPEQIVLRGEEECQALEQGETGNVTPMEPSL